MENNSIAFMLAAGSGDIKQVKIQYKSTLNLATKSEQCYKALYFACFNGRSKVVNFLLGKEVDPNFTVGTYLTPLHAAIFMNHESIVETLLQHGANVNPKIKLASGEETDYFCSPLIGAAYRNNTKLVEKLLQNGAVVNTKIQSMDATLRKSRSFANSRKVEEQMKSLLTYATLKPHELFEDSFHHINGYSPLHFAARENNEEMAEILLNYGADVNSHCDVDLTPLCFASVKNNLPLVKLFLEAGADLKAEVDHGKQLLSYILLKTLEDYPDMDCYDGYHKEKWVERNKVFSYLLKSGADPNEWSRQTKETILHFAAKNGMANAVHLLLKRGADVNAVNVDEKTPLECAVEKLKKLVINIQDNYSHPVDSNLEDVSEERRRELQENRNRQFENRKIYNLTHNTYNFDFLYYKYFYNDDFEYSLSKDPNPFRMISQLLTRELVRLEALGKRNVQQNVKLVNTTFVKPYYTRCKNELKKLKMKTISAGVNYYDFLFANETTLAEYMESEKIASAIDKENCRKLFPNYSRFLRLNVKRGLKRKRPDVEESNGSSDEEVGKGSVQMRGTLKRRRVLKDFFDSEF